jgi:ATP-dependent Clp protease ATP-binding subunit ClpC
MASLRSSHALAPGARQLRSVRPVTPQRPRQLAAAPQAMFDRFDGDAVNAVKDGMDQAKKLRLSEAGA